MKLIKLSNEYLKFMIKSYHDDHIRSFTFDQFKSLHSELDDNFISDALYKLRSDGLIFISSYDNVPLLVNLKVSAITNMEEDTLLKKGYNVIKEIKSWF